VVNGEEAEQDDHDHRNAEACGELCLDAEVFEHVLRRPFR
jgi:hypothetical protein